MQFRPVVDTIRYILSDTPASTNLAVTRDALTPRRIPIPIALMKEYVSPRKHRFTLASWEGSRLRALASARSRSGPRAWEVNRLYVPRLGGASGDTTPEGDFGEDGSPEDEVQLLKMLDRVAARAGRLGAERVFLRIPAGSVVAQPAQRTGFFPYYEEVLLQGGGGSGQRVVRTRDVGLRRMLPQEEHAIFQLYCASTPGSVRVGLGMTFDQWKSSVEERGGGAIEEVYYQGSRITGWVAQNLASRPTQFELMVHPDDGEILPDLLEYACARSQSQQWLVPEYQGLVRELLIQRGFTEAARYVMLIKPMAVRVRAPYLSSREAKVW